MGEDIRTRWHDWQAAYRRGHVLILGNNGRYDPLHYQEGIRRELLEAMCDDLASLPHYFISPECLPLVDERACGQSIQALQRAGLAELRDRHCVVEFDMKVKEGVVRRHFVTVSRREFPLQHEEHIYHPYLCRVLSLYEPDMNNERVIEARRKITSGRFQSAFSGNDVPSILATVSRATYMLECVGPGFVDCDGQVLPDGGTSYCAINAPWIDDRYFRPASDSPGDQILCMAAGVAVRVLLGIMRTRGIERTDVSVPRLNKARAGRGKVPIRDHTIVRLGHYYTRSGEKRKCEESSGIHQRMHWRSSHTKRVWFGPRGDQQCREQLIDGYLVNYTDGEELPPQKMRIVKPGVQRSV